MNDLRYEDWRNWRRDLHRAPHRRTRSRTAAILLFPITLLWRLITGLVTLMGIFIALVLGLGCMALGLLLCATFIGGILGLPLFVLGLLLLLRALW